MGKSRRFVRRNALRNARPPKGAFAVANISPVCPGSNRKDVDGEIYIGLKTLNQLVQDLTENITVPPETPEREKTVKWYLTYVAILADVILTDMALSATHFNDVAILIKSRMLVEYAVRAEYYAKNPDYTLYMHTIDLAKRTLKRAKLSRNVDAEALASLELEIVKKKEQYAEVAHHHPKTMSDILLELSGSTDEYAWLYGSPSDLIHADPGGQREVLAADEQTGIITAITRLPRERVDALMVDAGANTAMFCDVYARTFHPDNAVFRKRVDDMHKWFRRLILQHPYGRDEEALQKIKEELETAEQERA